MDTNRSVLIIRILRSGQDVDTTAFFNDPEAGDAVCYGKAFLPDNELSKLCEDAGRLMSAMVHPDQPQHRLLSDMQHVGRTLFESIFNPETRELLKGQGINYLALSIDEQLMRIPWELLYDGEEFLSLRYAIGIIPGSRQERFDIEDRDLSKTIHALVMAPSSSYSGLTYHEGVAVINKLYLRRDAIKTMLKVMEVDLKFAAENMAKSNMVHFLGHSNYNAYDQSKSGWSFKGGIFSAGNIRDISRDRVVPFFVFADTTQPGKPEEWPVDNFFRPECFTIAGAFLQAGTRNFMETFWKIPDEARLLFVREFYGFAIEGFPIGEALRLSRLKVVEAYGKSSLSWANGRLYGNPAISLFEKERLLSASVKKSFDIKNGLRISLPNMSDIRRSAMFICLAVLFIFSVKSIAGFLNSLEISRPEFETGLKYIFSQKSAKTVARSEAIEELQYLGKVDAAQGSTSIFEDQPAASSVPAKEALPQSMAAQSEVKAEPAKERVVEKAGGSDVLADMISLAEKEYFDLLLKDTLTRMSRPSKFGRAELYLHRGNYKKAGIYAKRALQAVAKANNMPALSEATALSVRVYIRENRLRDARKVIQENEKVFRKNGYEHGIADSFFLTGLIYALPKGFSERNSTRYLGMAVHNYLSVGDRPSAARACLISGYTHLMARSYTKAVKDFAQGLSVVAKLQDDKTKALLNKALGDAYFTREKYAFARAFYKRSLSLNKKPATRINEKTYGDILHRMALYELREGKIKQALSYCSEIDRLMARAGRGASMNSHNNIYGLVKSFSDSRRSSPPELDSVYFDMASACFELGYIAEANAFMDRGMQYKAARAQ